MTPLDILKTARQLLAEKGWTQFSYARDANSNMCDPTSPNAACYCSLGALQAAARVPEHECRTPELEEALTLLYSGLPSHESVVHFNDSVLRKREEVLELFSKAIAKAEELQS